MQMQLSWHMRTSWGAWEDLVAEQHTLTAATCCAPVGDIAGGHWSAGGWQKPPKLKRIQALSVDDPAEQEKRTSMAGTKGAGTMGVRCEEV